jgi:hypothetical protein
MKVVHLVEGHNFHVDWHFKFGEENCEKTLARQIFPVFQNVSTFKVSTMFPQNPLRKTLYDLFESCRG